MDSSMIWLRGALPALVPSCVGDVCCPPIDLLDYCIVLLDYTVRLSSCYYSNYCISFYLYCFTLSWKIAPPMAIAGGGGCTPSVNPSLQLFYFLKACLQFLLRFYMQFFWWMYTTGWVMNVQMRTDDVIKYTWYIHNLSTYSHASEEIFA